MPQSPELAGGAGHTFEDLVTARYFSSMLAETVAPGIRDRVVCRVALQQRDFGEPLDDLIVDLSSEQDEARLSLQLKRSLTISDAQSNEDFRDIIRDCWLTLQKPGFRNDLDRYGVATETVSAQRRRALNTLCDLARASPTQADFDDRFQPGGNASDEQASIKSIISNLIADANRAAPTAQELYRFLRHFVLLQFDQLSEAAGSPAEAIAVLAPAIAPQQADRAPMVWDRLCSLARAGAGQARQFVRNDLLGSLTPIVRLAGAPSLRADLELLTTLARNAAADIDDDVAGTRIDRPQARQNLADARARFRFVQVQGLPGSGKSVLLRHAVEDALVAGNALFLKADRLQGTSWAAYAASVGLRRSALGNLLAEISATGTPTLFIDGLDRVELANRSIILDLVRTIIENEALADWKIVATLRDIGVEHVRTWLPRSLFEQNTLGTVTVGQLDASESRSLANAQPALEPLLFGPPAVREIVRRPFFAKILGQNFGSTGGDADFMPRTEIDLIQNWWDRGGYSSDGQAALGRRLALLDVGRQRALTHGLPVELSNLRADSTAYIHQLVADGILQAGRDGVSVRFAHDIFFEWTYFHFLLSAGAEWPSELRAIGEPPLFGRIVSLLSQASFTNPTEWVPALRRLQGNELRSQWLRAWLLGPIDSPIFDEFETEFLKVVTADDCRLLNRVLVWFQAERTIPNPAILRGDTGDSGVTLERRIRAADLWGWPSDYQTWGRLIGLLLRISDDLPVYLVPRIVAIFEVWQNALADVPNHLSSGLLSKTDRWLGSLDGHLVRNRGWRGTQADADAITAADKWKSLRADRKELAGDMRRLILRGARAYPDITEAYLRSLLTSKKLIDKVIDDIFAFSFLLAQTHPDILTELSLFHLREELPADAAARIEREDEEARLHRQEIRQIPEFERTRNQELALQGMFSRIGSHSYSHFEWERLALEDDRYTYFPASPLKEPFNSLFTHAPNQGLRLLRELSNHAMTAWQQLHELDWERQASPIPLEIHFPWGTEQYWGTTQVYLWSRGCWAPNALCCAWLSAENWAFAELERGADPDSLIRQVVEGNSSIASLGLAMTIAREARATTDTVMAMLKSCRVWRADIKRAHQEISFKTSSLMGFIKQDDLPHAEAVDSINKRPVRDGDIRDYAASIIISGTQQAQQLAAAFDRFVQEPQFEYEEHKGNPEVAADHSEFVRTIAPIADISNYRAIQSEGSATIEGVYFVDPNAHSPEGQERQAEARRTLSEHALYVWSEKSLQNGTISDIFSYSEALAFAQRQYHEANAEGDPGSVPWGGVAGAAAVALQFNEISCADDRDWARGLLETVANAAPVMDPHWYSATVLPWHAGIFAARGLAADLRNGEAREDTPENLLRLIAHPLDAVALAAFRAVMSLYDIAPEFCWTAIYLAFDLCKLPPRGNPDEASGQAFYDRKTEALATALEMICHRQSWPTPPLPGPPWTFVAGAQPSFRRRSRMSRQAFDSDGAWHESRDLWNSQFAAKIIDAIPFQNFIETPEAKAAALALLTGLLEWTIECIAPHWDENGRDAENRRDIFEWRSAFARSLGRIAGYMSADECERLLLGPIIALRDDPSFSLLGPLVDTFLRAHVLDAAEVAPSAERVMNLATDRLLAWPGFDRTSYRAGELHGFDIPTLADGLMFVAALKAPGAARFANGEWRDIAIILPVIDKMVSVAGWSGPVMSRFLKLCEHTQDAYPVQRFADQVLSILLLGDEVLAKWSGLAINARIAGLVQIYADRQSPLDSSLATTLLRILDILVDQGDRRSAALQLTEAFREIRLPVQLA